MLTASFRRSALSWPGNLKLVVTPDMVSETKCLKKRSTHRSSGRIPSLIGSLTPHTVDYYTSNFFCNLARHLQNSQCSLALHWIELKGSTTVSDTLGLGTTLYEFMMRSGNSSLIFEIKRVPMPDPVPPPKEWVSWKPCKKRWRSYSLKTLHN